MSSSRCSIPEAARVLSGPGERALTRMPLWPELGREVTHRSFKGAESRVGALW